MALRAIHEDENSDRTIQVTLGSCCVSYTCRFHKPGKPATLHFASRSAMSHLRDTDLPSTTKVLSVQVTWSMDAKC